MFGKNKKFSDSFLNGRKKSQIKNILGRMTALLMACMLFSLYVLEAYAISFQGNMSADKQQIYASNLSSDTIEISVVFIDADGDHTFVSGEYSTATLKIFKKKPGADTTDYITTITPSVTYTESEMICTANLNASDLITEGTFGDYTLIVEPTDAPAGILSNDVTITYKADEVNLSIPNFTFDNGIITPTVTFNGSDISSDTSKYTLKYKKDSEDDSAYDESAPVNAGSYTAKVTLTDSAATNTANFTIDKAEGSATLTIDDIAYGGTLTADFTSTNGSEYESLQYKVKDAADGTYSDTQRTAVGDYTAKITFAAKENYKACAATDDFSITAIDGDAAFSVADIVYGATPNPSYESSTNGTDAVTITYKISGADDSTYTSTVPTDAGDYTAKAVFAAKDQYKEVVRTDDFTIAKAEGNGSLTVTINEDGNLTMTPESATNGTENVTYRYKVKGAADSTYVSTQPTEIGEYTAEATFAATANYNEVIATADFEISALAGTGTFQVADIVYGQTINPVYSSTTNGTDNVTITYKVKDAADSTYSAAKPTDAGIYTAKAVFAAKGLYGEVELTDDFTIEKAEGSGSLTVTVNADGSITKTPVSSTNGITNVTYQYKVKGAADSTYSDVQPTETGEYTIQATFAETTNYKEATATADFALTVLEGTATFQVADIIYGQTINPVYTSATNGTDNVTITYKVKDAADSTYTSSKPTDAGTYTAKAVFAAKGLYGEVELSDDFTIEKAEGTGSLAVTVNADGSLTLTPESTTNGTDNVSYQYKVKGAADSTYTAIQPTAIGTYTVQATFAGTKNYKEATATANFEISVLEGTATFRVADIVYGQTVKPEYSSETNGTKNVTITYKSKGAADSTYTATKPKNAGEYTAKAVFAAKGVYGEIVLTDDFIIEKADGKGSLKATAASDGKITLTPSSSTNGTKNVTYKYKVKGAADSTYSSVQPTEAGEYTVQATFAATENYKEVTAAADFKIKEQKTEEQKPAAAASSLRNGTAQLTIKDISYGQNISAYITSATNGIDNATVLYKKQGESDSSFSETVPTIPGKYTAKAIVAATEKYKEVVTFTDFEIKKAKSNVSVKVSDIYYGENVEPILTTNRDKDAAVYEYKVKGAADSTYTNKVPAKVGEYTVRAAYPENAYYLQAESTADFKIGYMPAPIFSFDGTKGDNKYFTSSVKVMPPKGYLISTKLNGEYSDMLLLTEDETYDMVYFKNKLTGATSAATALGEYEIDATKPAFTDAPLQQNVFAESLNFSLEDKNLMSVLVNGEEMKVNGSQMEFELTAEGGYKEYQIQATDRAGNVSELHFTLYSPWLQNRIIPENKNIMLEKKTEYFLSKDSSWKVSGDDTVYSGGGSFYIKQDGNYMFQKN